MAVQILNQMPDAEVHRGDPVEELLRELAPNRRVSALGAHFTGRAGFMALTIALHVIAGVAFLQMKQPARALAEPEAIEAMLLDAPAETTEAPPPYTLPPANIVYSLPTPQEVLIESEAITPPEVTTIAPPGSGSIAPPMINSVEYLRAPPPVYPLESLRRREYGTVVLRVLVDTEGRPAQIQIERSSGYERLDFAARCAVEKFLFRPYVVNGAAQAAQVLIPIGFDRRAS